MALRKTIVPIVDLPKPKDAPIDERQLARDSYKDRHSPDYKDNESFEKANKNKTRIDLAKKMSPEAVKAMNYMLSVQNGVMSETTVSDKTKKEMDRISSQITDMEAQYHKIQQDPNLSQEDKRIQLESIRRDIQKAKAEYDHLYSTRAKDIGSAKAHEEDIDSMKGKYATLGVKKSYAVLQQFKAAHPEEYKDLKRMALKGAGEYVKDNAVNAASDYLDSMSRHRTARKEEHQKIRSEGR